MMRGLLITTVIAVATVVGAYRSKPPSGQTVLANVRARYRTSPHLRANLRATSARYDSVARLTLSQPGKLRLDYPTGSASFDGTYLWVVDHANRSIFRVSTMLM